MNIQGLGNSTPIMDQEEFARACGLTLSQVRNYVGKGYLPVIRLNNANTHTKRAFINVQVLAEHCRKDGADWLNQVGGAV